MIIGNPILLSGGGGASAAQFHGVPGETVTWSSGTDTGTLPLSVSGDGSLSLPAGAYTFSFSISSVISGTISATLEKGVTSVINGWGSRTPAYWFGRVSFPGGVSYATAGNATATYNTTYISLWNTRAGETVFHLEFQDVSIGDSIYAYAYVDTTGKYAGNYKAQVYGTGIEAKNTLDAPLSGVTLWGEINTTGVTTLGVSYKPNGSSAPGGINLYAIWIE